MSRSDSRSFVVLSAGLLAIGCSKGAEQQRDTAVASAAVGGANANPVDTGMTSSARDSAGMQRDTSRTAPKTP